MELTIEEKRFLIDVLDKVTVQGIGNVAAVVSIYQKLSAQIQALSNGRVEIESVTAKED